MKTAQNFTKELPPQSQKTNGAMAVSAKAQTEREYTLRTFQVNKDEGDTLRYVNSREPPRLNTGLSSFG